MPDARDNAKQTGDVHAPEIERKQRLLPDEQPAGAANDSDAGQPGRDENAAGFVKDKDLGAGVD